MQKFYYELSHIIIPVSGGQMLNADRRFVIAELNIFNPVNPAGNLSGRNLDVADIARSHVKMLAQALNAVIKPGNVFSQAADFFLNNAGHFPHTGVF